MAALRSTEGDFAFAENLVLCDVPSDPSANQHSSPPSSVVTELRDSVGALSAL